MLAASMAKCFLEDKWQRFEDQTDDNTVAQDDDKIDDKIDDIIEDKIDDKIEDKIDDKIEDKIDDKIIDIREVSLDPAGMTMLFLVGRD